MPLASVQRAPVNDFYMLHDSKPAGPAIGFYAGREIAETVIDQRGHRYSFEGLALRLRNGQFDVEALQPGEFIVQPGLVYCDQKSQSRTRPLGLVSKG